MLYEYVMEELENNIKIKGLWAKAYANSEGNIDKIEPLYVQYRVQSIKDIFISIEISYNEMSRQKLFDFIKNGFKYNEVGNAKPTLEKKYDENKYRKYDEIELLLVKEKYKHLSDFESSRLEYLKNYNKANGIAYAFNDELEVIYLEDLKQ